MTAPRDPAAGATPAREETLAAMDDAGLVATLINSLLEPDREARQLATAVLLDRLAALRERDAAREDAARLDWLEAVLTRESTDPLEVFFAGLRRGLSYLRPEAVQIELESASKSCRIVRQADTLREAIDAMRHGTEGATDAR